MTRYEIDTECRVAVSPDEALQALMDIERMPEWSALHQSVVVESADGRGRPLRARAEVAMFGYREYQEYSYVWHDTGFSWETTNSRNLRHQGGSYVVQPVDGTSRIAVHFVLEPKIPVPGFVVRKAQLYAAETMVASLAGFVARYSAAAQADPATDRQPPAPTTLQRCFPDEPEVHPK
ncbi:SRPBCC family protein [Nocardia yamanashiensis]|uniref:SRPBCC family protein n=1 Tax=Nocardia yamanashiensis TaxID=209247 RepID=UPI001E3AD573|nr:SRPBCC family protein [Nocardia yamanashiensis]UGT42570.1 SRPBCC family protein [Nocardia yamanashiensis]